MTRKMKTALRGPHKSTAEIKNTAPKEHEVINCIFKRKYFAHLKLKHIFKSQIQIKK